MWGFSRLQHVKHSSNRIVHTIASVCASPTGKSIAESRGGIFEVLMIKDKTLMAKVGDKQMSFPSVHPEYPMILYKWGKKC